MLPQYLFAIRDTEKLAAKTQNISVTDQNMHQTKTKTVGKPKRGQRGSKRKPQRSVAPFVPVMLRPGLPRTLLASTWSSLIDVSDDFGNKKPTKSCKKQHKKIQF